MPLSRHILSKSHPKGPHPTENYKEPYGIHVSSPCDPPGLISHRVSEKGFEGAALRWSPVDFSGPWKIGN